MKKIIYHILLVASVFTLSCDDDDENFRPPKPRISFDDGSNATVVRNETVEVGISLTAEGGIASVTADGESLPFTQKPNAPDTFSVTYTFTAAIDEAVGDRQIPLVVTDQSNQSVETSFTLTVIGLLVELSEDITEDITFDPDNLYTLNDSIDIENGATVTIPAGTVIRARVFGKDADDNYEKVAAINVREASTLIINGTAEKPVVFTPDSDSPEPGMWAGIEIKGGSGHVFNYVRIEYAGTEETNPSSAKPSLYFDDGVENSTVDYVQIHSPRDIGIRLNGGNVDLKHIVVNNSGGSALRFDDNDDEGYVGNAQFIILNNPQGSHGGREIRTLDDASVTFSNVTGIGSGVAFADPDDETSLATLDFARFESSSGPMRLYNCLIAEYPDDGVRGQRFVEGEDLMTHSYIFRIGGVSDDGILVGDQTQGTTALRANFVEFAKPQYNNMINAESSLIDGIEVGDYVPGETVTSDFDPTTLGAFFEAASFVGAIGQTDWTLGWTLNTNGEPRN